MPSLTRLSRSNTAEMDPMTVGMKRRKSSVASLKSLPLAFRNKRKPSVDVPATHVEHNRASLLTLPAELQLQILQHLSFSDLCSLRATSRDSNASITGPDSAIARYWINSKLHNVHRLYPAPTHGQWQYLTSQMYRWNIARHLAEMIAYHIQYKTLLLVQRHSSSTVLSSSILAALLLPSMNSGQKNAYSVQKSIRFHPVAIRLRRKMTPLLFTFSHYLSTCQSALLSSQIALTLSGESTTFWTGMESPDRYPYPLPLLLSTHYCYLFLDWIFNSLLARPSYAGTIERAVRGWTTLPLDKSSLTQVLVHGNLGAVKHIFQLKDYGERKKWAKNYLANLNPEHNNLAWKDGWRDMHLRVADIPSKAQAVAILRGPGVGDSLWIRGAERKLSLGFGIQLEDNELHANVTTTMQFLTDLAGFDMFHEDPPEGFGEGDDGDGDDGWGGDGDSGDEGGFGGQGDEEDGEGRNEDGDGDGDGEMDEEERLAFVRSLEQGGNYWDV